jgi:hypothetical protein
MNASIAAVDGATIVGDFDPEDPLRYLCDVDVPGERFIFVAEFTLSGSVRFSPQAPAWLTGALAKRLAARVVEASTRAARDTHPRTALISGRRTLVADGLLEDRGVRRRRQVAWVAVRFRQHAEES